MGRVTAEHRAARTASLGISLGCFPAEPRDGFTDNPEPPLGWHSAPGCRWSWFVLCQGEGAVFCFPLAPLPCVSSGTAGSRGAFCSSRGSQDLLLGKCGTIP